MDLNTLFTGLDTVASADLVVCAPLLGVLLRTETRKL
jgi:hypothetical protein